MNIVQPYKKTVPVGECSWCPFEELLEAQLKRLTNGSYHILGSAAAAFENKTGTTKPGILSNVRRKVQRVLQKQWVNFWFDSTVVK